MHLASPLLFLAASAVAVVRGSPLAAEQRVEARVAQRCGSGFCSGIPYSDGKYVCGDPRLGPKKLPTKLPLVAVVSNQTYHRFGGLCPTEFIAKWWNSTSSSWIYPPDSGFQLSSAGSPIDGNQTLVKGQKIDRFGSEYGAFFASADTPYTQRALPPQSLDTPASDPSFPYNYHVYQVEKNFDVLSGPIAPWFGQPGQGTQYLSSMNVMTLLQQGYLSRVDLSTYQPSQK